MPRPPRTSEAHRAAPLWQWRAAAPHAIGFPRRSCRSSLNPPWRSAASRHDVFVFIAEPDAAAVHTCRHGGSWVPSCPSTRLPAPTAVSPSAGDFGTIILGMDLLHLVRLLTTAHRIFLFGSWVAGRSCPMNLSPWVLYSAMSAGGERGCR